MSVPSFIASKRNARVNLKIRNLNYKKIYKSMKNLSVCGAIPGVSEMNVLEESKM